MPDPLQPPFPAVSLRVLILEDDPEYGAVLTEAASRLARQASATVIQTGAEARRLMKATDFPEPVLVVVDLHLPDESGLKLLPLMTRRWPNASLLVLSALKDEPSVLTAITLGACGYLHKHVDAEEVARALQAVLDGQSPISPSVARHLISRLRPAVGGPDEEVNMTRREREILEAMAAGLSYKETAAKFCISRSTVESHIRRLYKKLGAHSKVQAISAARAQGIVVR
jgi:DNA-binding NarL/FixJ family response regulator